MIGVGLTVLGVAMLVFGVQLNVALPHLERGGSSRRYRSMFVFGVSYAVASLSCALPVFLAVTGAASATPTFLSGVLTYVVYGLGMSMLLVVLTIALSVAKGTVVRRLRCVLPYVGRLSGAILVLSGAYITVYWATNLRDPLAARGATFPRPEPHPSSSTSPSRPAAMRARRRPKSRVPSTTLVNPGRTWWP